MTTYTYVDGGTVIPGETNFTSYGQTPQDGEIGQLIHFAGFTYKNIGLYCIRKSLVDYVGLGTVEDYPVVAGADIKQWNPTMFVPVSLYQLGSATVLYFPKDTIAAGKEYSLWRVQT